MKHLYPLISGVIVFIATCVPREIKAQCVDCPQPGGGKISHTYVLDTTNASTSFLTFPQFNPSVGTLTCILLEDTVSLLSTITVSNGEATSKTYIFTFDVNTVVYGPPAPAYSDLFRYYTRNLPYPPITLGPAGSPTATVVYGPDTVFNNRAAVSNITPNSSYLGNGTVDLKFQLGGGASAIGGVDYDFGIDTKTWGKFKLTYYYCPSSVLSGNITNFNAFRKANTIQLYWDVNNEEKSNSYEIEISSDGINFSSAGEVANQYAATGTTAKYYYQYQPHQATAGKYYIRIRQIGADGEVRYSVIRIVNLSSDGPASLVIYPNPASDKVTLQFDRILKGNFDIDLINATGQVIFRRTIRANNTNSIAVPFTQTPPPGVYYLRAKDQSDQRVYTNKLLIGQPGNR